jgi:hypothetical protein
MNKQLTDTQKVFLLAKINGTDYFGETLPRQNIKWPESTWLSRRMDQLREKELERVKKL